MSTADLYARYSVALTAHINTSLGQASNATEDLAQGVWLWAVEQHQPPSWTALRNAANWLIRTELGRISASPELAGLRPAGIPVTPPPADAVPEVAPLPATTRPLPLTRAAA